MRNLLFIVSFLVLFCTSTISQITGPKVGEVVGQMGTTWNERDGGTENTSMGYELQMKDFLQTGEDGGMILNYVDGTKFTMGPNTELTIDEFIYDPQSKVGKIVSNIKIGTVKIITGEISKKNPDNLEVNVPTGSVGARGTEFVVVTESDEKSTVVLLGPGKKNTLGMIPGILNVSDGFNTVNISTPGFQSVVFK